MAGFEQNDRVGSLQTQTTATSANTSPWLARVLAAIVQGIDRTMGIWPKTGQAVSHRVAACR